MVDFALSQISVYVRQCMEENDVKKVSCIFPYKLERIKKQYLITNQTLVTVFYHDCQS